MPVGGGVGEERAAGGVSSNLLALLCTQGCGFQTVCPAGLVDNTSRMTVSVDGGGGGGEPSSVRVDRLVGRNLL